MRAFFSAGGMIILVMVAALLMPFASADTGDQESYSFNCITNAYGMVIICEPVETEADTIIEVNETQDVPEEPPEEPEEEEYCEAYWTCTAWSDCFNGIRVRGCTVNECVEERDTPNTIGICKMPPVAIPEPPEAATVPETIEDDNVTTNITETVNGTNTSGPVNVTANMTVPIANVTGPVNITWNVTANVTVPEENETINVTANMTEPVNETNITMPEGSETTNVTGPINGNETLEGVYLTSGPGNVSDEPENSSTEELTGYSITGMFTGIDTMFLGTMFMMILVVSGLAYFFSRSRI